ncbi:MAG: glycosyltransferase family 4 protein [Oscillatoriales cyanobacterium SM2_3_0]|nr:glycosyltransferase family 4 protein [Oscillatoriales cyanobacterium SM2_3_0]
MGRVSPEKGVHLLIEAFCQIAPQYPGIELKIVGSEAVPGRELLVQLSQDPEVAALARFYGDGSYLQQLKQRVPQEFRPQVHFVGAVPYQKLSPFYQNADILINPSLSEAFGMSLVEAMANEVPTIGARVGGMTTVIRPGETGLLFESDQVDQLAQAILKLLANPELRRSMGLIGRQRVIDLFSWDRVADSLQKHYQDLV